MGFASSSAARLSDAPAYGSLAGLGPRKLKKKPVLVLDPEELEAAHRLFQEGGAEQLGEFQPEERPEYKPPRLGLVPMAEDDTDPVASADGEDEAEMVEDDVAPMDRVLALVALEEAAEAAAAAALQDEAEPAESHLSEEESFSPASYGPSGLDQDEPSEAPLDDLSEASLSLRPAAHEPDGEPSPMTEGGTETAPAPKRGSTIERAFPTFAYEPLDLPKTESPPRREDTHDVDEQPVEVVAAAEPVAEETADADEASETFELTADYEALHAFAEDAQEGTDEPAADDFVTAITYDSDEATDCEAPVWADEAAEFAPASQNQLRARLVREEIALPEPQISAWARLWTTLRRLFVR